ncbi:hypothetical protein ACFL5U_02830 [Candidatus Margulisiibacteriota bacterium]
MQVNRFPPERARTRTELRAAPVRYRDTPLDYFQMALVLTREARELRKGLLLLLGLLPEDTMPLLILMLWK